jgi:hypothetical protein
MKVPGEGDKIVKSRSKKYTEEGFMSSDGEDSVDLGLIGQRRLEDNSFIEIIKRAKGIRINYNMIDPKDKDSMKMYKFYLSYEDHERMSKLVKQHRDILIFVDGSSRNNPGKAGAGLSFFGRKIEGFEDTSVFEDDVVDISINTRSDNLFDILANEKKMEIMREHKIRSEARLKPKPKTADEEFEERQFMFGA